MLEAEFINIYKRIGSFHDDLPVICEIRHVGKSGERGVFATMDIAKGRHLFREKPLLIYSTDKFEGSDVSILRAWCRLKPLQKYLYNAFTTGKAASSHRVRDVESKTRIGQLSEDDIRAIVYRAEATQFGVDGNGRSSDSEVDESDGQSLSSEWARKEKKDTGVIGWLASHLNHSCSPNAAYRWNDQNRNLEFHSLRAIKADEEINISYIYTTQKDVVARRGELELTWGFVCQCAVCKQEEALARAGAAATRSR